MNDMTEAAPAGELFSRVYLERGAPLQDSARFRNRLYAYLQTNCNNELARIAAHIKQEGGLIIRYGYYAYEFTEFFTEERIEHVLDAITLIWKYFDLTYTGNRRVAGGWYAFVSRALREENMSYRLDDRCGVHYFVDEEFERNRVSALSCLSAARYAGIKTAFEAAHGYLDAQPADTKASVRSAFEALEILARLMDPASKNLNKWMVENKLKPLALAGAAEATEQVTVSKLFDGLAQAVDGLQNYRHGQPTEEPVAPSMTMAVYALSTIAAALRWLVAVDAKQQT
ncbi:MAG: hypothetical protein K0M48_00935 [Thiobacillus sp.]|nr:hypothetical protein [Thiobacillus sp.]